MYRFLIVIEKADGNYSAYSPDLPGCVATGKTREQATRNMYEAIEMHVRGLVEDKLPVPKSHTFAEYVAVPAWNKVGKSNWHTTGMHIVQYNFEWDPSKAILNLRKHKISFERAAEVFLDPNMLSIEDDEHS
jgi:predicted RNase H-like HicB family nuclease